MTEASPFDRFLEERSLPLLQRRAVRTLQLNIGLRCNLACHHCHVESGPKRSERLPREGVERVLRLLEASPSIEVLDITGGAPELHEDFRFLVAGARARSLRVIDRCNLTVFQEPGQEDTPEFLAEHAVEVVASLPCYTLDNVERQRGRGVFDGSIRALQKLNSLGYGGPGTGLTLNLVYNPGGAFLPPEQAALEATYRETLRHEFGIEFDSLLTITNMPIKRFAHELIRDGMMAEYMSLLIRHFNPANLPELMCQEIVSIDWRGRLFDCDFNQALDRGLPGGPKTIWDIEDLEGFEGREIATAEHCFGCTAGAGSSCGGALAV